MVAGNLCWLEIKPYIFLHPTPHTPASFQNGLRGERLISGNVTAWPHARKLMCAVFTVAMCDVYISFVNGNCRREHVGGCGRCDDSTDTHKIIVWDMKPIKLRAAITGGCEQCYWAHIQRRVLTWPEAAAMFGWYSNWSLKVNSNIHSRPPTTKNSKHK